MQEGYWDKEEFEDLVTRGLIALYETNEAKENKYYPRQFKVNEKELLKIRKFGCYFSPDDRGFLSDELQVKVDGFPAEVSITWKPLPDDEKRITFAKNEYLTILHAKRMNELPGGVKTHKLISYLGDEVPYSLTFLCPTIDNKLGIQRTFFTVDMNGKIHDTYFYSPEDRKHIVAATGIEYDNNNKRSDIVWASCVLGLGSDKKHLWNVTANEGFAKATFGVYPEQIKSLFYSRELPMTETGRKRPILHWVRSHRRRIKEGIEVDIEKHLKGINEFVYNGTKFIITRPLKLKV